MSDDFDFDDDLFNYDIDISIPDPPPLPDLIAPPLPTTSGKKNNKGDDLGLDDEVEVKKTRVSVKLDVERFVLPRTLSYSCQQLTESPS